MNFQVKLLPFFGIKEGDTVYMVGLKEFSSREANSQSE